MAYWAPLNWPHGNIFRNQFQILNVHLVYNSISGNVYTENSHTQVNKTNVCPASQLCLQLEHIPFVQCTLSNPTLDGLRLYGRKWLTVKMKRVTHPWFCQINSIDFTIVMFLRYPKVATCSKTEKLNWIWLSYANILPNLGSCRHRFDNLHLIGS